MKKILLLSVFFMLLLSCYGEVKLNRVKGIKGPDAPVSRGDTVAFALTAPGATLVTIAGTFNGWDPQITPMKEDGKGRWTIELKLDKGKKHQYKYLIDGFWIADPDNPETVPDGSGGVNSVVQMNGGEK